MNQPVARHRLFALERKMTMASPAQIPAPGAKPLLLTMEEQTEYNQIRQGLLEAWNPKTGYERILFEDTVRAHWLWTRAQRANTAVIEAIVQEERKADPKLTADQALARVFTVEKNAKRMRLVMRYESAAERTYRKSMHELQRITTLRAQMEAHRRLVVSRQAAESNVPAPAPIEIGSVSHIAGPQRR
jgi:hypothetical protein